ncbi:AGO2 isoform 3 [Pan troglodytes]|uniref:Argonaute RISC catalytic component 2 n=2 Tax=Homininae TaxID=207598 RepID=E5RGG9_HUMAN|nr:argonaute RISC catalytic component 2 [Homo sapiens]KAI4012088.1 argonaute RISC catalytic component 2 [Homo sapiens]PNI45952.1 AGO2 isoform 3 [Pan troglodytes]
MYSGAGPGKSWNTWSSTLKHRSLGIGSPCLTAGRIYTQPCPFRLGGTRWSWRSRCQEKARIASSRCPSSGCPA